MAGASSIPPKPVHTHDIEVPEQVEPPTYTHSTPVDHTITTISRTTTTSTASPATPSRSSSRPLLDHYRKRKIRTQASLSRYHARTPVLKHLPLPAILIIVLLIFINLVVWAICALVLSLNPTAHLIGTAALAYSLGLRHALDADHISAIDLMTRRLIASGQRPVTVGTWFSLGHSTIVVITSIVVAATAAGVEKRFGGFESVGGIVGTSVSAAFLLLLGIMNAYILYKLVVQMRRVIDMPAAQASQEAFKIEGGGVLFRLLKRMFKLIDRPWKMYPLGVLFGLGFDTSSEIALLGISSIQGARGTSMWLILVFPVLFTAGMCLVDTMDGALMMGLYTAPMGMGGRDDKPGDNEAGADEQVGGQGVVMVLQEESPAHARGDDLEAARQMNTGGEPTNPDPTSDENPLPNKRLRDPVSFLYYSITLTTLTVLCAIIIGTIQLLTLLLNVISPTPTGPFWDGVQAAGDSYEYIGAGICASFILVGIGSVLAWKYGFKGWVKRRRARKGLGEERLDGYRDEAIIHEDGGSANVGTDRRVGEGSGSLAEHGPGCANGGSGDAAKQSDGKYRTTTVVEEVVGESSRS